MPIPTNSWYNQWTKHEVSSTIWKRVRVFSHPVDTHDAVEVENHSCKRLEVIVEFDSPKLEALLRTVWSTCEKSISSDLKRCRCSRLFLYDQRSREWLAKLWGSVFLWVGDPRRLHRLSNVWFQYGKAWLEQRRLTLFHTDQLKGHMK